jgi:uncharacterized membrane protein YgcG
MKNSIAFILFIGLINFSFAQGFTVKDFEVHIDVNKNGFIQTNEIIRVNFYESKHGIYRDIPYRYSFNEKSYSISISDIRVKDQKSQVSSRNGNKSIRIGDAHRTITGDQTYDISYKVDGPFIHTDAYDEFYWNITGNDWKAPIEKVSFDISLPDDIQLNYSDFKVFAGKYGSTTDSGYIQQSGRHITGQNIRTLQPGEGFTVSLRLPVGYIDPEHVLNINATTAEKIAKELKIQWPLAVIPAILVSLFVGFWSRLRKPKFDKQTDEPSPYPPDNMNPAEVGGFYDHIVNDRDVISLLPYWAAQGFIRMEYNPNDEDTYLTKIKDLDSYHAQYETTLFRNLFAGTSTTSLSALKYHFHSTHSMVKRMIHDDIIGKQLYDAAYRYWFKSFRPWLVVIGFITLGVFSVIMGYWLTALLFLLGFFIGIVLVLQPDVLSKRGEDLHRRLRAFYSFLAGADPGAIQKVVEKDPQYFDKVYPYAVALKLDKSFISKIKPYHTQAPMWYGYYGMSMMNRNTSMDQFGEQFQPKEINTAFSSVPQPTGGSSSGSSGGGFSGGGFGGGGGGSW